MHLFAACVQESRVVFIFPVSFFVSVAIELLGMCLSCVRYAPLDVFVSDMKPSSFHLSKLAGDAV